MWIFLRLLIHPARLLAICSSVRQVFHLRQRGVRCLGRSPPEKPRGERIALNSTAGRRDRGGPGGQEAWHLADTGGPREAVRSWCDTGSRLGCLAGGRMFGRDEAVLAGPPGGRRRAMPAPLWRPWPCLTGGAGKAASLADCWPVLAYGQVLEML